MLNLLVIITPLKTYLYGQTNFGIEVICLQHLLIECLEKYNFLKIADANSIFADVKSIMQLSRWHFFADVKWFELERLLLTISSNLSIYNFLKLYSYIHIFSPRKEFPSLWVKKKINITVLQPWFHLSIVNCLPLSTVILFELKRYLFKNF